MTETDNVKNSEPETPKTGKYVLIGTLTVSLCCILLLIIINLVQAHKLKQAALSIQIGGSKSNVYKLVGKPKMESYSGFSSGGGRAAKHSLVYGTLFNTLQFKINYHFFMTFKRYPKWNKLSENKGVWPVLIELDMNDIVIKVDVD